MSETPTIPELAVRHEPDDGAPCGADEAGSRTRPTDAAAIAVVVGLDAAALEACARVLGDAVRMIATSDGAAACELLGILRPGLVVVTSLLSEHEGARLEEAAASFGSRVVCVRADASAAVVAWFVRRTAAVVFGIVPPPMIRRRSPSRKEAP